jgi:two-component system response regulator FlrC
MNGLEFGDTVARGHAPLVQRAAAISASLAATGAAQLRDIADRSPLAPRVRSVSLERAAAPQIFREGPDRLVVRYRDAASDASLAALLAALARPGTPIAADPESLSILALAERLAASEIPVLINGPTGTGKEVLSRFIHEHSPRSKGAFVAVNCAATSEAIRIAIEASLVA